ncbi:MAG: hypothetical protein H6838_13560 [Planctomycetes bacterium]|nr:hypothetical protein [Planctomycetota bacterium]
MNSRWPCGAATKWVASLALAACALEESSTQTAGGPRFYSELGMGGRYLADDSIYGNASEHGVLSLAMAGVGEQGWGLEFLAAASFPSLWDTLPVEENGQFLSTDSTTTELSLGPCLVVTDPETPWHVRFGLGPSWINADVWRERADSVYLEEKSGDGSLGLYGHASVLYELGSLGPGPSRWTVGIDLRFLVFTQMDFFGESFPGQSGDADYFQFLLLFGVVP